MTRLLALLVQESLHKRIGLIEGRRLIALSQWARANGIDASAAANKAKRQTIPAFRVRGRWMIVEEYREE